MMIAGSLSSVRRDDETFGILCNTGRAPVSGTTVTRSGVNHPRLFEGRSARTAQPDTENVVGLLGLLRAFEELSGGPLASRSGAKPIHL